VSGLIRVVLLNWNTRHQTEVCLAALARSLDVEPDVLVVDNASRGGDAAFFAARLEPDRVLPLAENRGYTGGMNAGIRFWFEAGSEAPILVLTPDALVEPGTLRRLLDEMDATPDAGVVGPLVVHCRQSGRVSAGGVVDGRRLLSWTLPHPLAGTPYDTDWIDGCCMLLRPEALADVSPPFDERFFAYYEETEFCGRVRAAGWRVRVVPDAVVDHPKSVGTLPPHYFYYMVRNRYLFWQTSQGASTFRVAPGVAWATARSCASAVRALLLPSGRHEWRARVRDARLQLRGAWAGTRDHLRRRYGAMPDATMPPPGG
jgi:GT2 family glycosyltransferase